MLGGEEAQKTLGKYTTTQKQVGDATRMASHSETTSGHFGSLYEMTEVTQTVVSETESELT